MIVDCAWLLAEAGGPPVADRTLTIAGGTVAALGPAAPGGRYLAMPPLANAHDHARVLRMSSLGAGGRALEAWLHFRALVPPVDARLAATVALGRAALGGHGSVMVHHTRAFGCGDPVDEARAVASAARDVGVRIGFAVGMADSNPLVYGASEPLLAGLPPAVRVLVIERLAAPPRPIADQLALVDAVAAAVGSDVDVQYGPGGPHWASPALLEAVAAASAHTGRRVHMHLLETRYQRGWADRSFPDGVVGFLDRIGLLTPRLTVAHCTWARDDELAQIAARGATIAVNASSNLHLRAGIAPVARMLRHGCTVALGIDGQGFDEDDDGLRELRLVDLLHGAEGFRVAVPRRRILEMATAAGRRSILGRAASPIAVGQPADLLLLDWLALDDDRVREDLDPIDLLFARATARHVAALIVGGRPIVRDGRLTGVDLPALQAELRRALRAGLVDDAVGRRAIAALVPAVAAHFEPGCCAG